MASGNAKKPFDRVGFHVVTLLGLSSLLFFPFLGARDFWEFENQYAEVVRVMLLDNDYLIPKLNDAFFPDSPPLFFWVAALFCFLAGGVSEWPLRFPSALSATEMILLVYFFLQRKFKSRLPFFSSVVLACSVLTIHVERHVPVNMLFYLCIAAAVFLFMEILVFDSKRRSHAYGAWLCMALACLTNGPVGLLLPAVVVCLYLVLSRQGRKIALLRPFAGALIFIVVTAPWFVYLAQQRPTDWLDSLSVHLRWFDHGGPDQQIFFSFPLAFAPWCFLLIPAVICFWREGSKAWESTVLFFLIWFAVGFLLSVLPLGQHNHYLFLAYIPMAVGVGFYLDKLATGKIDAALWNWTNYSVIFFCIVLLVGGLSGPFLIRDIWPFVSVSATLFGAAVAGFAAIFLYAWKRYGSAAMIVGFVALPAIVNLLLQSLIFPDLNALKFRPLAEKVGAAFAAHPNGGRIAIYKHKNSHDFNYYSQIRKFEIVGNSNVLSFLDKPGRQWVLLKLRDLKELGKSELKDASLVLVGTVSGDRWFLLSSCQDCGDRPIVAKPLDEPSAVSPVGLSREPASAALFGR